MEVNISLWRENLSDLSINEVLFLAFFKSKMIELNARHISFHPKEVAEYLGFSQSWARMTFKRLKKKGTVKMYKTYFEITVFDYI